MLTTKTIELANDANELMDLCVKQMDANSIKDMDMAELTAIQRCIKLVDAAGELAIEQAKMITELNDKLDKVLYLLNKKEESE